MIMSIILGAQWGMFSVGKSIFIDPKVILSSIITSLYAIYLLCHVKRWL